jgi:8-oxo-dGTP pyrophosphatase MutT (NUDIX family)
MAASRFPTSQYTSEQFVESVGAILFRISSREICLLHLLERDEYVLAKGRRNCGESARETAVRELAEETGYTCRLMPVTMSTRAPPAIETEQSEDVPRTFFEITEPFTLQIRQQGENDVKIIWWYIAAIDEDKPHDEERLGEQKFRVGLYGFEEALRKLTFQTDRDMVKDAIEIFQATYA